MKKAKFVGKTTIEREGLPPLYLALYRTQNGFTFGVESSWAIKSPISTTCDGMIVLYNPYAQGLRDLDNAVQLDGSPDDPPTRNMQLICDYMREMGDPTAYVEMTGGGCATIYAGQPYIDPNDSNGPDFGNRYPLIAGPGWFEGPGYSKGTASLSDFSYSVDDDGVRDALYITEADGDEKAIAAKFMQFIADNPPPAGAK